MSASLTLVESNDPRIELIIAVDTKLTRAAVRRVLTALDASGYVEALPSKMVIDLDTPGRAVAFQDLEGTGVVVGRNGANTIVTFEMPPGATLYQST